MSNATKGCRDRPPSPWRVSFRRVTYECIKDSIVVEKAEIETLLLQNLIGHRQRFILYGVVSTVIVGCVWIDCD
jgi:hypothetical protein